jgi:hypothetical protein
MNDFAVKDIMSAKKQLECVRSLLKELPDFVKTKDEDTHEINVSSCEERIYWVIEFLNRILGEE